MGSGKVFGQSAIVPEPGLEGEALLPQYRAVYFLSVGGGVMPGNGNTPNIALL